MKLLIPVSAFIIFMSDIILSSSLCATILTYNIIPQDINNAVFWVPSGHPHSIYFNMDAECTCKHALCHAEMRMLWHFEQKSFQWHTSYYPFLGRKGVKGRKSFTSFLHFQVGFPLMSRETILNFKQKLSSTEG